MEKTNFDNYLDAYADDPEGLVKFWGWFHSRPQAIQDMIRKYPPGQKILDRDGTPAWVVSYQEMEDGSCVLGLSIIDPIAFYELANETIFNFDPELLI